MSARRASKVWALAVAVAAVVGLVLTRGYPGGDSRNGELRSLGMATARAPGPAAPDGAVVTALRVQVTAQGRALAGARVSVGRLEPGRQPDVRATSAEGVAEFSGLAQGEYGLTVEHDDFVRHARAVVLSKGSLVLEVLLARGGTLAGTALGPRGAALPAAAVEVFRGTGAELVKRTTSSPTGAFSLSGLPLEQLEVRVRAHPHRPARAEVQFSRDGERKEITLRLREGFLVSGRVLDSRGTPVAGAHVGSNEAESGVAITDDRGEFELGGLSKGPVNLFATAVGFSAAHQPEVRVGRRDVELVLEPPARVRGALRLPPGASRVDVSLCHFDSHFKREVCVARRVHRSPAAIYELDTLPSGNYELVFEIEGHPAQRFAVELASGAELEGPSVSW